ncbi:hypothetical protein EJ377_21045 [Chryseobacterium arthrosphaerae]|uniref:Uncharacterized protein n=1 Tax=Chryseobacterium arthrosphaerae TaxID=651561 RepID=A0A3S0N2M4_9FLAO|nr:hypothetical protein EJ377_21045 [Chryseobacterium arthrosphaerae]
MHYTRRSQEGSVRFIRKETCGQCTACRIRKHFKIQQRSMS